MTTNYISVWTARRGFSPDEDDDAGELAVKKGQMLLLLDASDPDWWKFKIKTNRQQNNGNSGTVPKAFTQEAQFTSAAAACESFIAQADGDLTIFRNDDLSVYCIEGDWALVKGAHAAGYVPRACIKLEEEMNHVVALFDFQATEPEHLGFGEGETLTVLDRTSKDWWRCENADHEIGTVPVNLVKLVPGSATADGDTSSSLGRQYRPIISSDMDVSTIVSILAAHGCTDLSSRTNYDTFSDYPIANGGFADVYRGQLSDGTMVAVKNLRISYGDPGRAKHLKHAARELHSWSKCSHPNILPLLGLTLFRDRIGMVSPWMQEGTLPRYLERNPRVNRCNLCRQVCEGLSYLHGIGFIHGSLRGSNILISNEGAPLLCDFGESQSVNRSMEFTQTNEGFRLALRWAAPELITYSGPPHKGSDVYSLGMTLYEVMTGQIPHHEKSDPGVILDVVLHKRLPKRTESITDGHEAMDKLWELLLRCWSYDPTSRPSAAEVAETMRVIENLLTLSRTMAAQEVVSRLVARGCDDLSHVLNLPSFSDYPVSHGGISDIYQGQLSDGTTVAVKVLRVSIDSIALGSKHLKHAARELYTWNRCKHPNIMPLLGLAVFRDRIGMVAPWMNNGNLPKYLKRVPGVNRYNMCVQICEGLSYLHQIEIVHCDLKGANVLISDEGTPLLTDFGTSLVSDQTLRFTATTSGPSYTLRWSSAELLQETSPHTKVSDIYALGMTIYETMTGKVPFQGRTDANVILRVTNKEFPERPECMPIGDQRSDKLWELLVRCWSYEPEARPNADEATKTMREIA
ncbi:unnamed protein product [Rhizoctonia solani]|uniref:mitogen-activated protein kinase kinase kinase n=1 Tax=Rhizoctonia solani TaxID=456999 RepID=A0A8H3BYD2_9AGAM|nr:unnamed protein product [Rhizoctonia solani]